jgi:RNA polymerase sigma factor (sigma-70 family)
VQQKDYINDILQGNQSGLTQMFRAIYPAIRALVRDYGNGSEDDAKDLFQEATILIYEKAQQPGFQLTSQFSTFFIGISRNLWMSKRQKKSASEVTIPEEAKYIPDGNPDADLLHSERGKLFYKALRQLGEDCQKVLELFFQKYSMEEIAQKMGFGSADYAKRRKGQCKDRLVENITNMPEYHELQNH